jgi:hypothetical protein
MTDHFSDVMSRWRWRGGARMEQGNSFTTR